MTTVSEIEAQGARDGWQCALDDLFAGVSSGNTSGNWYAFLINSCGSGAVLNIFGTDQPPEELILMYERAAERAYREAIEESER